MIVNVKAKLKKEKTNEGEKKLKFHLNLIKMEA